MSGINSNTQLMLQLNNSAVDTSQNAQTITNNNVTFLNVAPKYAGTYYGVFNGISSYLTAPDQSYLNFGGGNFAIDTYINVTAFPSNNSYTMVASKFDAGQANGFFLTLFNNAGVQSVYAYSVLNSQVYAIPSPAGATWYHLAWVRSGNNWTIYWNGSSLGTLSQSGSIGTNTAAFCVGARNQGGAFDLFFNGQMQGFRVNNNAVWTSDFTPPSVPYSQDLLGSSGLSLLGV